MRIGWSVSSGFFDGPEFLLYVIMSLFLLTGYELGFHGLISALLRRALWHKGNLVLNFLLVNSSAVDFSW